MNVTAHTDPSIFDDLRDEWNPLLERSFTNTVFSTWEWHKHWWDAYHPGDLWILTIRDDADALVGIASFFVEEHDDGRWVHFIGCEDVTDYLDLILDQDRADAIYDALAAFLNEQHDLFTGLELCNIPEQSPTHERLSGALDKCGFQAIVSHQEVCPIIQLPETFDDYMDNLDGKQRRDLRRKLRIADAQRERGIIQWYMVDESHDLDAEIDRFLHLMRTADREKAAFLEDPRHIDFFRKIIPAAMAQGWLHLVFITINDDPAAAYFNFDYNNHMYVYNSGLDTSKYGKLSPGIVLLAYNIQHAIENHFITYDFLRGDEQYKYRMGAEDTPVYNLKAEFVN